MGMTIIATTLGTFWTSADLRGGAGQAPLRSLRLEPARITA